MEKSLYDEFGNYIGPELDDEEEEDSEEGSLCLGRGEEDEAVEAVGKGDFERSFGVESSTKDLTASRSVVLYEDRQYYPDAEDVYQGVETLVEDEDTQPLTEPIVAPVKIKDFDAVEKEIPVTSFSYDFLASLMYKPQFIRHICFLGHFHSGKTSLVDVLVKQTHNDAKGTKWSLSKPPLYCDSRKDEIERGLSVKAVPLSLVLPASQNKSYLFYIFDTPGHVNFQDECTAAMRLCDGAVIVVDALSGVMCNTEKLLQHALQEKLSITIVINCIDRLILELRLPPTDAYFKLRHTLEEINAVIAKHCHLLGLPVQRFSPVLGNVAFASGFYGFIFTLKSFAQLYVDQHCPIPPAKGRGGWLLGLSGNIDIDTFAKHLWGDIYYTQDGQFSKTPENCEAQRSFVTFILNPIYKLFAHSVGEEKVTLQPLLESVNIFLKDETFKLDSKTLLREVCKGFFGNSRALVDLLVSKCPNPKENALVKVGHCYSGALTSSVAQHMINLDHDAPLVIHVTKSYHRPDCTEFDVFGRVMSGVVYKGQKVRVLGETYTLEDPEDAEIRQVSHLWIYQAGRYRVEISHVPAGNWVLLGGLSPCITKTATITNVQEKSPQNPKDSSSHASPLDSPDQVEIFRPLKFFITSIIRVSCEPLNPSELPKMLEGFRKINKAYPLCQTKVEESGEHVILGTGELYVDCILHDLRKLYGDLEIKVADPVVQFCETVVETSTLKCFADTPNRKNRFHMIAEPLEKGLGEDIERGVIVWPSETLRETTHTPSRLTEVLETQYHWDPLAARSVWAFGPDDHGPNVLIDDTLPTDVDKNQLKTVKNLIIQGFQWVTREGPLIEEPVRNCKFRLMNASISSEPSARAGGQIIPTSRRVAYSAFLLATPRLMEPVLFIEVECPADCVPAVYTVLARRRGHVAKDIPKPGTPLYIVHAYLPAIESFGFETDLRIHTSGQAFCLSIFDHWALVPGDPLDKSILLRPLEPAPAPHLAREFLLKTRRRKGLSENVAIYKFFDDPMLVQLAKEEADLDQYL